MINLWTPREPIAAEGDGCSSCSWMQAFAGFAAGCLAIATLGIHKVLLALQPPLHPFRLTSVFQ